MRRALKNRGGGINPPYPSERGYQQTTKERIKTMKNMITIVPSTYDGIINAIEDNGFFVDFATDDYIDIVDKRTEKKHFRLTIDGMSPYIFITGIERV